MAYVRPFIIKSISNMNNFCKILFLLGLLFCITHQQKLYCQLKEGDKFEETTPKLNPKFRRHNTYYYPTTFIFRYDPSKSFGIMISGLSSCRSRNYFCSTKAYFSARLNNDLITNGGKLKTNNKLDVPESLDIKEFQKKSEEKKGKVELLFGFTNQLVGPSWLYMGAGLAYHRFLEKMDVVYNDDTISEEWVLNESRTKISLAYETGFIIQIKKITLMGGVLTNDFNVWDPQFGLGFAF